MSNYPSARLTILLFFLFLQSCAKSTMVSGRVTNLVTGNPVKNMKVSLSIFDGNDPRDSSNPKKVGETSAKTDENGFFSLELSDRGIDKASLAVGNQVFCNGFFSVLRSEGVAPNKAREVNIQIDSIDAVLDIVLQNTSGTEKTVFLQVDCDVIGDKGNFCCNHDRVNPIAPGAKDTVQFKVTSSRFVRLYWGEQDFSGWASPRIDSVFCPRNVATGFIISL